MAKLPMTPRKCARARNRCAAADAGPPDFVVLQTVDDGEREIGELD
jgi:hypothetical protein